MTRADRLQPVQNLAEEAERRLAQEVAALERNARDAETKLHDLERYAEEYQRQYTERVGRGIGVTELRDYQAFLARLGEAMRQQRAIVTKSRNECDAGRLRWQEAAKRVKALDHVATQWRDEARRAMDRREQIEIDERAQRPRPQR
jgi:flagellar FliJ protein